MAPVPTRIPPVPSGACDSHLHIFDRDVAGRLPVPPDLGVEEYRAVRDGLGLSRAVLVQPRAYWTDNSVVLAGIAALGKANTRGVAVVHPDVSDDELQRLHDGGVRGIRFTLHTPVDAVVGFDMVEPLAARVHDLGWHLQLHWTADQIIEHKAMVLRLPTPLVFDHMVRLPAAVGSAHPAFDLVRGLLADGRGWAKLSGAYLDSRVGERGGYSDMQAIARAWVEAVPGRLVWGSDWPHMTERPTPPDTAGLLDLLADWAPDEALRNRILVDNAAELYGFAPGGR